MGFEFNEFAGQFLSRNAKSTALYPLGWLIGILSVTSVSASYFGCAAWIGGTFTVTTVISVVAYLLAYGYFGVVDRDRLQTERWSLQKMAMERGLIGDDLAGFVPVTRTPLLPPHDQETGEEDKP